MNGQFTSEGTLRRNTSSYISTDKTAKAEKGSPHQVWKPMADGIVNNLRHRSRTTPDLEGKQN
jgi:hypothetical protein